MNSVSQQVQSTTYHPFVGLVKESEEREARMLDQISGMYSNIFGSNSGPTRCLLYKFIRWLLKNIVREKHPVVFLPDGSSKPCKESGQMSSMGYLAFMLSGESDMKNWRRRYYPIFSHQLCCECCKQHQ